ncbi:MAG TPA: F0F1 ATP synthase subunit epsilon [Deltaproteobacteria bacterium]|nr:F0F1 ATP synthase subunit epsilon [Deltaproteobacteria bacterium]
MAETFLLEIVTPYRLVLSEEVEELTAPGAAGEFGVLPGHTNLLTILRPGEVVYSRGGGKTFLAVGAGYAEVTAGKTTLLVDDAERADEIDIGRARQALVEAEKKLEAVGTDDARALAEATEAVEHWRARVSVAEKRGA